jgi:VCBS repeat protein
MAVTDATVRETVASALRIVERAASLSRHLQGEIMRTLPGLALTLVVAAAPLPATAQIVGTVSCDAAGCTRSYDVDAAAAAPAGLDAFVVNRAENPNFDADLRAWRLESWPGVFGTATWDASDANGSPASGSARLTNDYLGEAYGDVILSSCLGGAVAGETYRATARVLVPPGQAGMSWVLVGIHFFQTRDCSGFAIGGGARGYGFGADGSFGWFPLDWDGAAPTTGLVPRSAAVMVMLSKFPEEGTATLNALFDNITASGPSPFVKGDMNRDGETDLLVHNNLTGQTDAWTMNNTVRDGAPIAVTPAAPSLDWVVAGVDDFNADLQNDLLMWNQATGEAQFWLMNGTVRVGAPLPLPGALAPPWKPSATADFNHDGKPDIVYRNFSTQKIVIWTMNGTTKLGEIVPVPDQAVDGNWEIVAALDFNNDTNTDFLWYNATSGKIVLWFMNASVSRLSGMFTNPPNAGDNNWKVLAAGDYGIGLNGISGSNDIVWRNETSGRFVVWHMDFAGNRTFGTFTTPMSPLPNPTEWTIAGPR